jgi:hypothetical protein
LASSPERLCAHTLCSCIALSFDAREMPLPTKTPQYLRNGQQESAKYNKNGKKKLLPTPS